MAVHEKGHPFIRDSNRCVNDANIHPYPVGSRSFDFTLSSPHLGFGPRKPSRNDSAKVPPNPTTRGAVWEEVGRGLQMLILDRLESRFGEVFLGGVKFRDDMYYVHVYNNIICIADAILRGSSRHQQNRKRRRMERLAIVLVVGINKNEIKTRNTCIWDDFAL